MSLTFKQRDKVIKKYACEYNKSKIIELKGAKLIDDEINEEKVRYIDSIDKYKYYYYLQEKIDMILDKLDWECSNFLRQEFFSNNLKQDWWTN